MFAILHSNAVGNRRVERCSIAFRKYILPSLVERISRITSITANIITSRVMLLTMEGVQIIMVHHNIIMLDLLHTDKWV